MIYTGYRITGLPHLPHSDQNKGRPQPGAQSFEISYGLYLLWNNRLPLLNVFP